MNDMNITSAKYVASEYDASVNESIIATIDGETLSVPLFAGNRHYDEIMRQVAAGTLTIADAD
jgi:hypothetical protein